MDIKVLMFGWEFPPYNSGGLGVACLGLTQALARERIDISFVLPKKLDISSNAMRIIFADALSSIIRFRVIDSTLSPYLTPQSYNGSKFDDKEAFYGTTLFEEVRRYALAGARLAMKETFDIIHAHEWLSFPAGIEAKRVSGKPLIAHVHATEFDRTGGNVNQHVYEIEKEGMEKADRVVAVSDFTKNIIVNHYGIEPSKITVIHNGIEKEDYHVIPSTLKKFKEKGTKIVLFVGRITLQKGPDYFLRAAQKTLSYKPNVLFVIVGSGDMKEKIINQAAELGISNNVLFTGFLRGEELSSVYQAADLFVMPSVSEPFGLASLEALAHGTPVLISKQSGVSEVITHGLKVDFWDIDEMTNKILAVLDNQPLFQTLKEEGSKDLNKISWQEAAQKCISLYSQLLVNTA